MKLKKIQKRDILILGIVALLSLIISFSFYGKNLNAEMGIIDDHMLITRGCFHNPKRVIGHFISAPEFHTFNGSNKRFRVIYWLINDTEAMLFTTHVWIGYLINILVFAFFIFTIFYITYNTTRNTYLSTAFTLFSISQFHYLSHIFTRLGTAETWGILGTSLYSLGLLFIIQLLKRRPKYISNIFPYLLFVAGGVIAIGSKENFGILIVPTTFLILLHWIYKVKLSRINIVLLVVLVLFNIYQLFYVLLIQMFAGVDLYQNNLSFSFRIKTLLKGIAHSSYSISFFIIAVIILLLLLIYFLFFKQFWNKRKEQLLAIGILDITFVSIFLFNLYVYQGRFITCHRYGYPMVLVWQLMILLFVYLIYLSLKQILRKEQYFNLFLVLLIGFILGNEFPSAYKYANDLSHRNVYATTEFQKALNNIIANIHDPQTPIVFETSYEWDYEPLDSVNKYLRFRGVKNPTMVKTCYSPSKRSTTIPLYNSLTSRYKFIEKHGGKGFIPLEVTKDTKNCYVILFSHDKAYFNNCKVLGKAYRIGNYPY